MHHYREAIKIIGIELNKKDLFNALKMVKFKNRNINSR